MSAPFGAGLERESRGAVPPHLALIGLRASGKSTVGAALAGHLGREFVDLDDAIVRLSRSKKDAGALLAVLGEPAFRTLESQALAGVLGGVEPLVLATGGGAVLLPENRELLGKRARCVWLDADVDLLRRRLAADGTPRPALLGPGQGGTLAEVAAVARQREPLYRELAALRIDAAAPIAEIVADIANEFGLKGTQGSGGGGD